MDVIEVLGMICEVLSWIGLGLGLPMLLLALLGRTIEGRWVPSEIAILDDPDHPRARWFAASDFWERPLRQSEAVHWEGQSTAPGYVSERHPRTMRFEPHHPALHALHVLGTTLTIVGAAAVALSFVFLFLP